MLVRGKEVMVVGPNTVVTVPPDRQGTTTILQRAGEIVFDVDKRNVKHFAVETPYLAALVKGTRFTVQIFSDGAVVSVDRGLVEVTGLVTGETVDIPRGQRATIRGPEAKLIISASGEHAKVRPGKPRAPVVVPLSPEEVLGFGVEIPDASGSNTTSSSSRNISRNLSSNAVLDTSTDTGTK